MIESAELDSDLALTLRGWCWISMCVLSGVKWVGSPFGSPNRFGGVLSLGCWFCWVFIVCVGVTGLGVALGVIV